VPSRFSPFPASLLLLSACAVEASPSSDDDTAGLLIGARLEVPLEDNSGWETLYQGDMRDLGGSCDANTGTCVGVRLLSILFDTPGMRRGFPTYRVAITLAGPQASQGLPALRCTVHHDRHAFLFVMAALRAILIAATIVGTSAKHRNGKPASYLEHLKSPHVMCGICHERSVLRQPGQ
jgi:hypothetical protein